MIDYFEQLLHWIEQNPESAGLVIFSMALAESLAIVGVLIPGVIILFGAGTLIGAGVIDFWSSCLWAVAGAIIGDGLSYWLGHHFEYAAERWPWLRVHPEVLQKGIHFFEKYGDISVALGRFFGPIRAIVPLIAGLLRMPPKRFYIVNVLSALVWAPAYLLPGMLVGSAATDSHPLRWLIPAGAVALIFVIWWIWDRPGRKKS
ncbi:MAG: DedA family protein [Chromatiales bacterium]|jgi:undecaprenyl-diphosphatase